MHCFGSVVPHHLQAVGTGNNRKKPSLRHFTVVPLCAFHHEKYHSLGYSGFQTKFSAKGERIDLFKIALSLTLADIFDRNQPYYDDKL